MKRQTLFRISLGVSLFVGVSCNPPMISGGEGCPPEMPQCDPNNPTDPNNPGNGVTTVGVGPGSGGSGGSGGTPFDPMGDGSSGVAVDPMGNVILDPNGGSSGSQSVIWIANSADSTVSKVDTRTMKQIARYRTFPGLGDPSRTSVSLGGDVAVANRAWQNGAVAANASVVKIAGDKGGCIDRNGNGVIDTYEGEATTLPAQFMWTDPSKPSPDECVLWLTPLNTDPSGAMVQTLPRAAGFDGVITDFGLSQYLYVGLYNNSEVIRIDAATGKVVKRISVAPTRPYGLVIDKDGSVWASEYSNGNLAKVDVANADKVTVYSSANGKANPCPYGVTSDSRGYIYGAFGKCVSRFNPTTETWERLDIAGAGQLRGLALDNKNQLYAADDQLGLWHVDASAVPPATGTSLKMLKLVDTRMGGAASQNVGAAIDFDNKPWVISQANRAIKIDPATNYSMQENNLVRGSYTYSDMSGYQLRNASRAGTFRYTFKGCDAGTTSWQQLTYSLTAPAGTRASVRYRAAQTTLGLPASAWTNGTGSSPVSIMLAPLPAGQTPRYLQVEINMSSVSGSLTPILSGLAASFSCTQIIG